MTYNLVIFGVKSTSETIIKYLNRELKRPVDLIVTLSEAAARQHHISGYQNLQPLAAELGIKCHLLDDYSLMEEKEKGFWQANDFNLGIAYGWQRLIPADVLARFSIGVFGWHGSAQYLPAGKGHSPLNWSLLEDRKIFHNHLFKYVGGADAGPIFNIKDFEINQHDNIATLQYKSILTAQSQIKELLEAGDKQNIQLSVQSGKSSFYPKRTPQDGRLDFKRPTLEIYNLIRATAAPFPGAFCFFGQNQVTVWEAYPFDSLMDFSKYKIGQVIETINDWPVVKTTDGSLIIKNYEAQQRLQKGDQLN
ncbi:MAG: hypothetical protein NTZ18_04970 [Candidatus Komeilibacteria bacterium]|nr:hypothetical protein [Candidatus Komeilibacteria bacterium]